MEYFDYLRLSEQSSWSLEKDIPWQEYSADRPVSKRVLTLLQEAAIIESFAPIFVMDGLHLWQLDIDESAIASIQFQDEYRHYFVLQKYLALHNMEVPERKIIEIREKNHVSDHSKLEYLANYFVSEHYTAMFYLQLLEITEEPVLRKILTLVMQDEFRHSNIFYALLQKHFQNKPDEVRDAVMHEAQNFRHFGLDVLEGAMPKVKEHDMQSVRLLDEKIKKLVGIGMVEYRKQQLQKVSHGK